MSVDGAENTVTCGSKSTASNREANWRMVERRSDRSGSRGVNHKVNSVRVVMTRSPLGPNKFRSFCKKESWSVQHAYGRQVERQTQSGQEYEFTNLWT